MSDLLTAPTPRRRFVARLAAATAALGAGLHDHLRHGTPAVWEAAEGTR